jgi:hypothetical protein
MPKGKGTYGRKVGRPPKKGKKKGIRRRGVKRRGRRVPGYRG